MEMQVATAAWEAEQEHRLELVEQEAEVTRLLPPMTQVGLHLGAGQEAGTVEE